MLSEHELQQLKHHRAKANEILAKLTPDDAVECLECGCTVLWAHKETGDIRCGGCGIELDGQLNLEDE